MFPYPSWTSGAILFDYNDVEEEKEAVLRKLCLVMRAYLQGRGQIAKRRRLFRRGELSILRVEVDGCEWRLGQSTSSYGSIEPER
ncbi:hypothetical protein [Arthrobacter tecti]